MGISAFIQAGGRSSRMGTDKAWLKFGNKFAVELVIQAARPVVDELAIVANKEDYKRLELPVYPDVVSEYGPLGGIKAALLNAKNDLVLIVACDLPFVSAELFRSIIASVDDNQIVVPLNEKGQTEQMCALYSKCCLPVVDQLFKEEIRTPRSLFDRCRTKYIDWSEISALPNSNHFFDNLNTPEDYQRALAIYIELQPA